MDMTKTFPQVQKLPLRWTWPLAVITTMALCGAAKCTAQEQNAGNPVTAKEMRPEAVPDWEVAAVKPSNPNDTRGQHIDMSGRHLRLLDTTVEQFLLIGYSVQQSQLAGEPEWVKTTRWDVDGLSDVEAAPNLAQLQGLIRKILTERFGLQLRQEQRELPVFALIVAKGGPRIVANTSDPNGIMDQQQNGSSSSRHVETLRNASMADLSLILQFHVDRPIVDHTGLRGRYDFKLQWATDDAPAETPDAPPGLFTAIQEQIGLKLERMKAPANVLVIEEIAKPGAN